MALNFPNVSVLGYSQTSRNFEASLQYSNLVKISIEGLILDLTAQFGITGIWTGLEGILPTIANNNNFQPLILNGKNFGTGRIDSISFKEGQDVRTKLYTATLTIHDSGNLFNLGGTYYNTINSGNFQYLENFNENYTFDRKINGGYTYNHTANIRFNSGVGTLNSINTAKILAKTLFTGANLGFLFYSGDTNKIGKRFYNESYNLINNECNFQETFDFDADLGNYSATRTNSFELAENGNISVTENTNIRGIIFPTYKSALAAINTELTNCFDRCNDIFNIYAPAGSSSLVNSPTVFSKTLDIFNNNLDYSITYENNPRNFGGYFWDYTQTVDRTEGIAKITENGTIIGRGENRTIAYAAAQNGLNVVKAGIDARITSLYTNIFGSSYNYLDSREEGFSPYKSICNYTYQYTNELVQVGSLGVKKVKVVENDVYPLYSYNKLNIINIGEIAQNNYQVTVAEKSISLELDGEKVVPLVDYLTNAVTIFNNYVPTDQNPYILSAQYVFAPNENKVNANLVWHFNKIRFVGDITL